MKLFSSKSPKSNNSGKKPEPNDPPKEQESTEYPFYHADNDEDIYDDELYKLRLLKQQEEKKKRQEERRLAEEKDNPRSRPPKHVKPDAPEEDDRKDSLGIRILKIILIVLASFIMVVVLAVVGWKLFTKPPEIDDNNPAAFLAATPEPDPEPDATDNVQATEPPESDSARRPGTYTFVAAAQDQVSGDTDTIMVGMLDTVESKLNVISIPRDTLANITWGDSKETKKINQAFKRGGDSFDARISNLKDAIRDLVGFNVDNHVIIDMKAFEVLIDTIGGVDFDVPMDMIYHDPVQDFEVNIKKGYQHLNGKDALKVVRFRGAGENGYYNGDIGRIETQQAFLMATAEQLLRIGNITKAKQFAQIFVDYVETSWTMNNIAWLGEEFLKLDKEDISFLRVPGNIDCTINGISFVSIDLPEWITMINESLSPYKPEYAITEKDLNIITIVTPSGKVNTNNDGEEAFKVTNDGAIAGGADSFAH